MSHLNTGHDWPSRLGNWLALWTVRRIADFAFARRRHHRIAFAFWNAEARDANARVLEVEQEYRRWEMNA